MNADMFGTLPDGTLYTKRRNLWTRPKENVVTYKGYACEKWSCGIGRTNAPKMDALYGDEDYPYTPAPEIDETVVLE